MELKKFIVTLTETFNHEVVVFADSQESAMRGTMQKYLASELDSISKPVSLDVDVLATEITNIPEGQHLVLIGEPPDTVYRNPSQVLLDPDACFLVGLVRDDDPNDAA